MSSSSPSVVTAGMPAPDFSLPSTGGGTVTLGDRRSHKAVLLAFFPKAFTSVCTSELCAFSDDFDAFSELQVEVLPISVDTVEELQRFREAHAMRVELLSDIGGVVARQYGAMWTDGVIANRAYFLIDRDGVVRWAHVEEHPGLRRENAQILEKIRSVI